jgi:hypothetical protein
MADMRIKSVRRSSTSAAVSALALSSAADRPAGRAPTRAQIAGSVLGRRCTRGVVLFGL